MASDAQLIKRDRYLAEGKIKVIEAGEGFASIFAYGSSEDPYVVRFRANAWSCTCPAQKPDCVHVLAAMQISPLRSVEGASGLGHSAELDELLGLGEASDPEGYELVEMNLDEILGGPDLP